MGWKKADFIFLSAALARGARRFSPVSPTFEGVKIDGSRAAGLRKNKSAFL